MIKSIKQHFTPNEEGFTLIELLVVIVIIGILAAIALPIFMNQQKQAHDAALKSDMKTALIAVETFRTKYPQTSEFNVAELNKYGAYSTDSHVEILGTPNDFCLLGTNKSGTIAGGAGMDEHGKVKYLSFVSKMGGGIQQKYAISGLSCYDLTKRIIITN